MYLYIRTYIQGIFRLLRLHSGSCKQSMCIKKLGEIAVGDRGKKELRMRKAFIIVINWYVRSKKWVSPANEFKAQLDKSQTKDNIFSYKDCHNESHTDATNVKLQQGGTMSIQELRRMRSLRVDW